MELIRYSNSFEIVTESGSVASDCQGILFINEGQSACTILGHAITQSQSFSPPCNIGEIDCTNYHVMFDTANSDQRLLVIRKNYV